MQDVPRQDSSHHTPESDSTSDTARALERKALSAKEVHDAILEEGKEELERSTGALAFSALTAGLSMGFSLVAEGLLRTHLPDAPWRPLVAKLGYVVGFLIVVLGRQQLFTETTLTAVLPLLNRRDRRTLSNVGRLWIVVLVANLAGAAIMAWALTASPVFELPVRQAFTELGMEAAGVTFGGAIVKGIFAGWLIALMVWLLPAADTAKPMVIAVLTYVVGLGQLTHIIAGSVEVLFLAFQGGVSLGWALGGYMLPTLIGNTIGGVLLVAALNYAQATTGEAS
jgi:formate/nitrite transporter FocA (FNT family)